MPDVFLREAQAVAKALFWTRKGKLNEPEGSLTSPQDLTSALARLG